MQSVRAIVPPGDPNLAARLRTALRIPVFAGPMFISSTVDLLIAQCRAGIIGSMPALNPKSTALLDAGIVHVKAALAGSDIPYAINLVAHRTNTRLAADLEVILAHRVPVVVLALATDERIIRSVHDYGGIVFNDVINNGQARKCAERGVDGLIAVCAGAGGHTGTLSPFALSQEIRDWWTGPLALAGCIATGRAVIAAEAMGADFAYIGSPFLATDEANTQNAFKAMVVESDSKDIMVTNCFTGVNASFLRPSIIANGLDPAHLVRDPGIGIDIDNGGANAKAWRDIWSAGQGIGAVTKAGPAAAYVDKLVAEYRTARASLALMIGRASNAHASQDQESFREINSRMISDVPP